MHKEKVGNHMEDYHCLGVFFMLMIMQKWPWEYTNHALNPLLPRSCNMNKFENSSKERIDF
jgi:hypothetical protein